jgi:hypothetical protein
MTNAPAGGAPDTSPMPPVQESVAPSEDISAPAEDALATAENADSADKVVETSDKPADTSKMSDEEFEAFMKKAQAFYSGQAEENSSNENIAEDSGDDDEFPSLEVHSGDD